MIRKARRSDLYQINEILSSSQFPKIGYRHLRDSCLVGVIDDRVRGVIWASVGKSGCQAHVDYFAVDPQYKGLGVRLALAGLKLMKNLGIETIVTTTHRSPARAEVLRVSQWIGLSFDRDLFHFGSALVSEMRK